MTTIASNYIVNSISNFFKSFIKFQEIYSMKRAAEELHRMGYIEEYKSIVKRLNDMENKK